VLAGSAAFTDQLTTTNVAVNQKGNFAGYGTLNVTNGSLEDISYTLSTANPPVVTGATLEMFGDTHHQTAYMGFNEVTPGTFGATDTVACAQPGGNGYAAAIPGDTEYNCDLTGLTPSDPTPTVINDTDVALANT
jgi:hypothetical protein